MSDSEKYIFEQGEERERTAIIRLIADRSPSSNIFYEQLKLTLPWCWIGIRIPQRLLLKGLYFTKDEFNGDIDFLAGNLEPTSQELFQQYVEEFRDDKSHPSWAYTLASMQTVHRGEIRWIPRLDFIAASECKASYFNSSNILKVEKLNLKVQKSIRNQTKQLCELGFNRVALSRFVVTEPITSTNLHPWFEAGKRASYAQDLIEKKTIFEETDIFGTVIISVGSIVGGLENFRGSFGHKWLKDAPQNSISEKAMLLRKIINKNLIEVMSNFPTPRQVPVLILCCSNPKCLFLYVSQTDANQLCPKCNWKPR